MNNCRNLSFNDGQPQKKHLHTPLSRHRQGRYPLCLLPFLKMILWSTIFLGDFLDPSHDALGL